MNKVLQLASVLLIAASCTPDITRGYNPYSIVKCSDVVEYLPAPGQFIGEGYEADTMEEACEYAYGRMSEGAYVSLGAFGGYIVAKLEHDIGGSETYIAVVGNSTSSSSEPGIVYYMYDVNRNGLADEEWHELEGSLHGTEEEFHDYSVTYFRPEDGQDVYWKASDGSEGHVTRNSYHSEADYYPAWVKEDSYTLTGIRLKSRAYDQSGNGTMWINPTYGEGYADNYANEFPDLRKNVNKFFGKPAITQNANILFVGRPFDFVKVQTAVMDQCGWIGEISTEVCGVFAIECHYVE